MNSVYQFGRNRFIEAVRTGERLPDVLNELLRGGELMLAGGFRAAWDLLEKARQSGIRFSSQTPLYRELFGAPYYRGLTLLSDAQQASDPARRDAYASALVHSIRAIRPYLRFGGRNGPTTKPEPLEIKIVGLPDRVTTSEVVRDSAGNITQTVQHEFDELAEEAGA
jgi:hypothetical protein